MQEDQLWAMQDYVQQYQQLVCQFRSENASLRRQLSEDRSGAVGRETQPPPHTPVRPSENGGVPKFQGSPAPGPNQKQGPSPKVETPDVPPLGQGTSIDLRKRSRSLAESENSQAEPATYSTLASYENQIDAEATATASGSPAQDTTTSAISPDILLSGEVIVNEGGGGPRLMIHIESLDESGCIAGFDGTVSLALLTTEGGVQRRIARWDFGPDDVRSAVDAKSSEPTMQFRVELPAGTDVNGPTELWAKLAPTNGARLFSHAKLDLSKPGIFSSRTEKIWASEESVVAASYVDTSTQAAEAVPTMNVGSWATAVPGKPAILPAESNEATGGWKAASGPLPAIVENAKPRATKRSDPPKPIDPARPKATPVEVASKPSWAADRPSTQPMVARPSWSATR